MHILHVFPPLSLLIILLELLEQAVLPEVLLKNILADDIGAPVIHGAVLAIGEALLPLEVAVAVGACPGHEMRLELHTILHLRLRISEISDEIEGLIVG